MTGDDKYYDVGYGKPPRKTQFAKGQSGNKKGRPKGSKNLDSIVKKVGRERVKATGNRGSRFISKLEAAIIQLANQAASGEIRAIQELLRVTRLCELSQQAARPAPVTHERDKTVMESIVKRIRASSDAAPNPVESDMTKVSNSEV